MATIDLNDERMFELVTEALRAGPGSPQWHSALALVRENGAENGGDDYAVLLAAREHLESGREYRAVKAGPKFTRKVMEEIDKEAAGGSARKPGWSVASIVAIVSLLLIVVAGGVAIYFALPGKPNSQAELEKLEGMFFGNPVVSAQFEGKMPEGWKTIGSLPLVVEKGLKPGAGKDEGLQNGGVVSMTPLGADAPFAVEVSVLQSAASADVIAEVFVADSESGAHSLAWVLQGGQSQVLSPEGKVQGQAAGVPVSNEAMKVRIEIGKNVATVELDGKKLWEGDHGLSTGAPRYVGVRFATRGKGTGEVTVQGIRVLKASL